MTITARKSDFYKKKFQITIKWSEIVFLNKLYDIFVFLVKMASN